MKRIQGLDLARTFAFIGMVLVNFKIVLNASEKSGFFFSLLEGKAAASFVVLAGISLGLSSKKITQTQIFKRSLFLFVIGFLNYFIFEADIIHYYAFYFFFGAFFIHLSFRKLIFLSLSTNLIFLLLFLILNYDIGWNWKTLEYIKFWTLKGFIRNLFFNGFHPIFPWLGFFFIGIGLAKLPLEEKRIQELLIMIGIFMMSFSSLFLLILNYTYQNEFSQIFTTSPMPPTPFYTVNATGAAFILIGCCLRFESFFTRTYLINCLTPLGRQTLTMYIAHIVLGMGIMEELGYLEKQNTIEFVYISSLVFCFIAILFSYIWSNFFKQGLIELLMRKITK